MTIFRNELSSLSDLCDLVATQVDPTTAPPDVLYVGLEHVTPGRLIRSGGGLSTDVQSHKFSFQPNDVLYGKLRPYLDKAVLADTSGICTTELLVLRAKEGVPPQFLACLVHAPTFIDHAMMGVTGAHHPRTSWSHIAQFECPDFSHEDQGKIAALLWTIQEFLRACENSLEAAQELKRAAMHHLFTKGLQGEPQKETDLGLVPESWEIKQVRDDHDVVSGGTPSRNNANFWDEGTIPWVKTGEVNYCVIQKTEEHITHEGLIGSAAKLLPPGTLLMAMYGQGVTRGKVAILGIEATCNQACAAIQPINNSVYPKFLYHFLASKYESIRQLAHGGQQQNLNLDIVRDFPIAVPKDVEEQKEIATILDAIDQKIDLHKKKKGVLEELFKALLHKLMTGEIRVADLDLSVLETQAG